MTSLLLWYHRVMSAYYLKKAHNAPHGNWKMWLDYMHMSKYHAQELMNILQKEQKELKP